jgi:hypothetical protein
MLSYLFIDDEGILPTLTSKHSVVYIHQFRLLLFHMGLCLIPENLLSSRSMAHSFSSTGELKTKR